MSEQKRLLPGYVRQKSGAGGQPMHNEQPGWEAYRKWLSGLPAHSLDRKPFDASVYNSWRGYHVWADKIRRSWDDGKA